MAGIRSGSDSEATDKKIRDIHNMAKTEPALQSLLKKTEFDSRS